MRTYTYIIKRTEDGMLLRDYLHDKMQLSHRLVKRVKSAEGQLLVNGKRRTVRYKLAEGDELVVVFPKEKVSDTLLREALPLAILYEDEDLLVINKQPYVPTIPSRQHPSGTIANGVLHYYAERQLPYTIHIVTRLDKDTSGVLLIAKHQYSHSLLTNIQRKGQIKRTYQAIVHGHLHEKNGTIDAPIARQSGSIIERTVSTSGKRAITHYSVVKETERYSLVTLTPETGRTHQLRVHLSSIGHPIVGDDLYGGKRKEIDRQALHCANLQFPHPFRNQPMEIEADLRKDMLTLLQEYK